MTPAGKKNRHSAKLQRETRDDHLRLLFEFHRTGVKAIKDVAKRAEASKALIQKLGGRLVCAYVTTGKYDAISIIEMPNGDAMAKYSATLAARGFVRDDDGAGLHPRGVRQDRRRYQVAGPFKARTGTIARAARRPAAGSAWNAALSVLFFDSDGASQGHPRDRVQKRPDGDNARARIFSPAKPVMSRSSCGAPRDSSAGSDRRDHRQSPAAVRFKTPARKTRKAGQTRAMKRAMASRAAVSWSRWASAGTGPARGARTGLCTGPSMASSCSSVPYWSSAPWIAKIGQDIAGQEFLDVPGAEFGRQPDIVPAAERAVEVVVISRQPAAQFAPAIIRLGLGYALDRNILDEDMRRFQHQRPDRPFSRAGVNERDRSRRRCGRPGWDCRDRMPRAAPANPPAPRGACKAGRAARGTGPTCRSPSANRSRCGSPWQRPGSPGNRATGRASPAPRAAR